MKRAKRLNAIQLAVGLGAFAAFAEAARGQAPLPFSVGEELSFRVRAGVGSGRGTMRVEGPADVRGIRVYVLRSEIRARLGPVSAVNHTTSWLDPERMTALRFAKHERQPLEKQDQDVELFPDQRRWTAADGTGGETVSDRPLDELSFIYFIRTLPLTADTVYRFDRHFEAGRNPVTVRVVKRDSVQTAVGTFRTVLVEMRVKDPRRYGGNGVIRIQLSDDERRLPVRIESTMPIVGKAVLTLEAYTPTRTPVALDMSVEKAPR